MAKLTKADAARQLGISRTTLYKLIDQGKVSATSDGMIDQAELVRVAPYVDTLKERSRTSTNNTAMDTSISADEHRERPSSDPREQPWIDVHERQRTSAEDLVNILREQLQLLREEPQEARHNAQAAREREALLLQMLQEMQHRYDRLLEAPRPAQPPTPRERGVQAARASRPAGFREPLTHAPAFDPRRYVLGTLCPRGHDDQETWHSLLRLPSHGCLECDRQRARERRQARRQQAVEARYPEAVCRSLAAEAQALRPIL